MATREIIEVLSITDYLLIFALIFATYVFNFYYKYLTRPNPLHGPFPLPFIGNLHNIAYDIRMFYDKCRLNYGDICEITFEGSRCIILSRPEYIEKLMSTCIRRLPYYQGLDEIGFHGHGIAGNDVYESWRYNRQFFDNVLMAPRFKDYTIKSINKLLEELSGYWQSLGMQCVSNNKTNNNWTLEIDFSEWFHAFANETISVIITGERTYTIASYYNTQSVVKHKYSDALVEDGNKFAKALLDHIQALTFFMLVGKFLRHYVPIIRNIANFYLKNRDYIYERLDLIIKRRREKIEEMPVGTEMGSDMLTSLITLNTEKDTDTARIKTVDGETFEPMPDEEIRSNLLEAIGAGSDSTANTFCYITYYVGKYPNVKQKMISEIDSVFSKSSNQTYLTSDDLLKLKYCEAIIKEALRMIPATNMVTRHMTEECEIAGYKWAAGTVFHINLLGIHSNPEVWPNPEVFDPDRFYNVDQYDKRLKNKYSLITFGGGLRICPGRKLAMTQLLLWMSSIYRYYNVELVNMHEPLKIHALTANNVPELKVRISPRVN